VYTRPLKYPDRHRFEEMCKRLSLTLNAIDWCVLWNLIDDTLHHCNPPIALAVALARIHKELTTKLLSEALIYKGKDGKPHSWSAAEKDKKCAKNKRK
jgi:hypothetical protein